ncbi:MAG: energy transducer TonB [Pseudomonadota bacterium]
MPAVKTSPHAPPPRPRLARHAGIALGISGVLHAALLLPVILPASPQSGDPGDTITRVALLGGLVATGAPPVTSAPALPGTTAAPPAPPLPPLSAPPAPAPERITDFATPGAPPPAFADLGRSDDVRQAYAGELGRWLARHLWYPPSARADGIEGQVAVVVNMDRSGRLLDVAVARSSGHPWLDQGALETVRRAAPLPPLPEALPWNTLELELPVFFRLEPSP